MTILDQIIKEKEKEVMLLKENKHQKYGNKKNVQSFHQSVLANNRMSIIAEIKRASPSKGMIHPHVNPAKQAILYESAGAQAISVLTDEAFFKGHMDDLRQVREAVDIPILCKDFMIDPVQIDIAKDAGANIILLIAAALNNEKLRSLYNYAKEKDLEVLCEVHNEKEMEDVLALDPLLIGVNNRNLKNFHVDLTTTKRLANMVNREDCVFISESGLQTEKDIEEVARYGAKAVLVGETFMRSNKVTETIQSFQVPLTP